MAQEEAVGIPGAGLDLDRMPGHWVLAQMGKRVLRPGGLELTTAMLEALAIHAGDHVVELAPGLGTTTRMVLQSAPASYTAVERDPDATALTRKLLRVGDRCLLGSANHTGLEDASATVVFGEAMLTMNTADQKRAIVREALRVLRPGGRYGIHELALAPDYLAQDLKDQVQRDLSSAIRVGARPLTVQEWRALFEDAGFEVVSTKTNPMHLLEPSRVIADEGLRGALRIGANLLRTPVALRRVRAMRSVFRRHREHLCAVMLVAKKTAAS